MRKISILMVSFFFVILFSCSEQKKERQIKNPTDSIILAMQGDNNFSIILKDMDYKKENFVHKYQIIKKIENVVINKNDSVAGDSLISETTNWIPVSEKFFNIHEQNMGMEIVSKTDGKISKIVSPAGYSQYIGNNKYGEWQESGGNSTWHFIGQYMFMSAMFNMMMFPVHRSYYNNYSSNRNMGRNYYGSSNGNRMYGTNSSYSRATNTGSSWGKRPASYKQSSRNKSKIQRNNSRYQNKSTRSRSGGYGK